MSQNTYHTGAKPVYNRSVRVSKDNLVCGKHTEISLYSVESSAWGWSFKHLKQDPVPLRRGKTRPHPSHSFSSGVEAMPVRRKKRQREVVFRTLEGEALYPQKIGVY